MGEDMNTGKEGVHRDHDVRLLHLISINAYFFLSLPPYLYDRWDITIKIKLGMADYSYLSFYIMVFLESWLFWVFLYQECKFASENNINLLRHFFLKPLLLGSSLPSILTIIKLWTY